MWSVELSIEQVMLRDDGTWKFRTIGQHTGRLDGWLPIRADALTASGVLAGEISSSCLLQLFYCEALMPGTSETAGAAGGG